MDSEEVAKKSFLETFKMLKLQQLNELHKENEFCDLTLKCEDGFEIKVHRVVISCVSNYFKNLITTPKVEMEESISLEKKFEEAISIPDITADVLKKIIAFIYTDEFEEEIEDIEKVIKYAALFQLQELVEICLLTLNKSINDHTCVKYWRLGRVSLIYGLEEKSLAYIVSKADHLFASSLMSNLTTDEMKTLLSDDRLHLQCDEKKIFEHVWKWAKGKISETTSFSQVFSEVVDLFHYSELNQKFIVSKIFFNDDLTDNAELLQKFVKLSKQKYKDEVPSHLIFHKPTQRRLFGLGHNKMFIGLGEENTIEKEIDLRCNFGYTTFYNKLLICGGKLTWGGGNCNSCEFFEPNTEQWKKFPYMKAKKQWHQCINLDNKIYACGGFDSNIVEIFDLSKGEWDYGPEMLANNWNFGLTAIHGVLYAIGGNSKNVEILDPRTQKWNVVCSDSQGQGVRCVSIGPSIYCFGIGKRCIFDTRSNNFTEEIHCKDFMRFWTFCELDDWIYGLGYSADPDDKYCLNLIQYHPDGKQGFKKSYGLYNKSEATQPAIVSLYY